MKMVVITEPEKRVEVSLKNLPALCCDIVNKKSRRMADLSMGPENYLEDKRIGLIRVAEKIGDKEEKDTAKTKINDDFEKAKEYIRRAYDGKEFNVMDRDVI